jgi:hypothetical protein
MYIWHHTRHELSSFRATRVLTLDDGHIDQNVVENYFQSLKFQDSVPYSRRRKTLQKSCEEIKGVNKKRKICKTVGERTTESECY